MNQNVHYRLQNSSPLAIRTPNQAQSVHVLQSYISKTSLNIILPPTPVLHVFMKHSPAADNVHFLATSYGSTNVRVMSAKCSPREESDVRSSARTFNCSAETTRTETLLNLVTVQQDATYSVCYTSVGSSTCFGCWHPSSGARTTVITASGID